MKGDYIPTLDGWRAVAILSVIFCHAGALLFGPTGVWPSAAGFGVAAHGIIGVDVFFALSGFLITSKLVSEINRTSRIDLAAFYRRRFFRILPAYMTYLVVLAAAAAAGWVVVDRGEILSCLLFYRNYVESFSWYTGHFWSLAVEEHFYLLWPTTLALLAIPRARWVGVSVALAIEVWRAIDARLLLVEHWFPGAGSALHRTDTRLDCLLWGSLAAVSFPLISKLLLRLPKPAASIFPIALAIGIGAGELASAPLLPFWKALLLPLLLVSTIVFSVSPLSVLLEHPLLRWIGQLSYSLYLWQEVFLAPAELRSPRFGFLQQLPWGIFAALGFAMASYYFVEKPFLALGRRTARKRPAPLPDDVLVGRATTE